MHPPPFDDETLTDWEIDLRSRIEPGSIKVYLRGVRQYADYCAAKGKPVELSRHTAKEWIGDALEAGGSRHTISNRLTAVRVFGNWLVDENVIDSNPILSVHKPKADKKIIRPFSVDDLKALVAVCQTSDFIGWRDEAIIRLVAETGIRASEVIALNVDDLDRKKGVAYILRAKGNKDRVVAYGPRTAAALGRYLRRGRAKHKRAEETRQLFLGDGNRTFGYTGLDKALKKRAAQAGIDEMWAHRLRHTYGGRWRDAGGSESGAKAIGGWATDDMLRRYSAYGESERAIAEAHALNLGDY
jgi:integrase/recombinase XerD